MSANVNFLCIRCFFEKNCSQIDRYVVYYLAVSAQADKLR